MPPARKTAKNSSRRSSSDEALLKFIAQHLARDFPNPHRRGCPPRTVLEQHALLGRKFNPKLVRHLLRCSPCFLRYTRKLRVFKKQSARTRAPKISSRRQVSRAR